MIRMTRWWYQCVAILANVAVGKLENDKSTMITVDVFMEIL